ncbi:MAG: rhamnulokinase family protein [Phycisphaeraceae bacterium]
MAAKGYVAFDLGAESGRAILAVLDGRKLVIEEAHRFANVPRLLPSGMHWDLLGLWGNLVEGLRKSGQLAAARKVKLVSLGVDTWGVDCALVGKSGQVLGLPFAYRDARHPPAMKKALRKLGASRIYDATGIQFMPFNTLFQLVAQQDAEPSVLENARHMLNMPDLLHYFFSGKAVNEATIASTTQMVNPRKSRKGTWHKALMKELGLPVHMLGKIVPAGTKLGKLRAQVAAEAGVGAMDVILPGSHDTASAVAAVPVEERATGRWAYLSSGTWSLMGAELDKPIISDACRQAGFTNERGVGGKIRFLKNLAGLWLVQEVRRDLARQGQEYEYSQLADLAAKAPPFATLLDPGHEPFASPGDMCRKIAAFARSTGQPKPTTAGQLVRACLESLALVYRRTLESLETLLGEKVAVLHIVGGGGKNQLLNQMTADAIGRTVIVGPYEATAIGNALTQAMGAGQVRDLAHLRAIVRNSFDPVTFAPLNSLLFDAQRQRFAALLGR